MKFLRNTLGFAVVGILAASMSPASSQQPAAITREVFSKARAEKVTQLDLGRKGLSAGDRLIVRSPLFDVADTSKRLGRQRAEFVVINKRTGLFQAASTAVFPEGMITVAGSARFSHLESQGVVLAITGGTGDYGNAYGTVTIQQATLEGEDGVMFTFDITE